MKAVITGFIFLAVLFSSSAFAQKDKKKTGHSIVLADRYFDNMEYYLAAKEYEKVLEAEPENHYAMFRIAESCRLFFDYETAEVYYKKTVESGKKEFPLADFWYAMMLKLNGQYAEAEMEFGQFINDNAKASDHETKKFRDLAALEKRGCSMALNEMKKPKRDYRFELLPGPVNTGYSEYSPTIYSHDSCLVVTSSRDESLGEHYGSLGGKFSDNFRFSKGTNWSQDGNDDQFNVVNTKFNESAGSFNKDKTKFYFTRCDHEVKIDNVMEYQCEIYMTKLENGKWTAPVKLNENINMPEQWEAQPSVSPNADTLFFVSKRPGGYGMHDIWYSTCKGDDNWGKAINMGPKINTPYIDMSPCYYSKERILFFASNGHESFGGLDIFIAKGNKFQEVKNAGLPFNSNRDDFYFVLGDKKGYLASNREGGIGNDDIYWFYIDSRETLIALINEDSLQDAKSFSIVGNLKFDDTKAPASDLEIFLQDGDGKTIKTMRTNEEGLFKFVNLPPGSYKIVMKENDPRLTAEVKYIVDDVSVKKSQQVASKKLFENIYFDFDKFELRREARKVLDELVAYYKKYPEIQVEMNANTDAIGTDEYNKKLSLNRGNAALNYLISKGVNKSGLVVNAQGKDKPIATNANAIGRQLNRRVEFYIIGGPGYEATAMAYVIEPQSTLNSVAKKFNMTVDELRTLNDLKNDELTAYRPLRVRRTGDGDIIAPATMSMLGSKDPSPLFPGGKTQTSGSETKTAKSPAGEPQLRSGEDFYIVEPLNTLYSIAKMHNMTPEELIEINGLNSNKIYIGQKLIVKSSGNVVPSRYVVKEGDTMYSISKRFGITLEELKEMNKLKNYTLYKGMVLKVKKD